MLRSVALTIGIFVFTVLMGFSATAFAEVFSAPAPAATLSERSASTSDFELPQVLDYSYKTALFEYFSGRFPSFDELMQSSSAFGGDDLYQYRLDRSAYSGDDNLALMAELSPEYKVYLGNLYQLFFLGNIAESELAERAPAVTSVLSMLKGEKDGVQEGDVPRAVWLLDKLYTHSYYSDLIRISKKELLRRDATGATAFFRGITLLATNNPMDATLTLKKVRRSSSLYPYARVAFAQALFDSGDLSGAERELKALLIGSYMNAQLREKVRLLLGQVYFEEDLFSEALMEFMNIPRTSIYSRESVIATAWALIKNNTFETAVGMLKEFKVEPPYDALEWEAQVMLGYGYMQLELYDNALVLFEGLLRDVTMARTNLEKMRKDSSTASRYLDYLLQSDLPPSLKAMGVLKPRAVSRDEAMYFAMLMGDDSSKILLQEYAVMLRLSAAILGKREEIAQRRLYLKNLITGMQSLFSLVDLETRTIKTILVGIDRRVDPTKDPRDNINRLNLDFFRDVEEGLYAHWLKIKKREINKNEKEVVMLLLYDVGESLDCVKSSLICTIVDMADSEELSSVKSQELSDILGILEAIALDIQSVRNGELIAYEKSIEDLRAMVNAKTRGAKAGIIHLDAMDARLRDFLDESDIATRRRLLEVVKTHMKRRVKGFKDDLTELRAHIMTGLISTQKVIEEMRADER